MGSVGLHVLVVDDDELNRVLVERVLTARGIEVETSPNGIAAAVIGPPWCGARGGCRGSCGR